VLAFRFQFPLSSSFPCCLIRVIFYEGCMLLVVTKRTSDAPSFLLSMTYMKGHITTLVGQMTLKALA
jgi:hypothetical protein